MAVQPTRISRGTSKDEPRTRRVFDFLNALVQTNGDFLLGDVTIGRGGSSVYTNAAIGRHALQANTTGQGCFAAGSDALLANTTGSYNTAAGQNALKANVTGQSSSAFGASALVLATGGFNDAFGAVAYASLTTGSGNAGFGGGAGLFLTDGAQNCHLGVGAGSTLADDITSVTSSDRCVFVGWNVHPGSATSTNEIAIGYAAVGEGSNTTVIGNSSTTAAHIYGALKVEGPVTLKGYTVATLPAGVVGQVAYVTDALAPAWNTALVGGGAVVVKCFYNGAAWVAS